MLTRQLVKDVMMQEKWKKMMLPITSPDVPLEMIVFMPQMRQMVMCTRGLVQGLMSPEIQEEVFLL